MEEIFYRQHRTKLVQYRTVFVRYCTYQKGVVFMQKTRKIFSRLTAAVLAGAMLVSGGAVSMTVSAASAKPVLDTDVTVPSAGNVLIGMEGT